MAKTYRQTFRSIHVQLNHLKMVVESAYLFSTDTR